MTVYLVAFEADDASKVVGIYSTLELAESKVSRFYGYKPVIQQWDLDKD